MPKKFHHPELGKGEKFLGNMLVFKFHALNHKTKRQGEKSFNKKGMRILRLEGKRVYPVFVQKSELKESLKRD